MNDDDEIVRECAERLQAVIDRAYQSGDITKAEAAGFSAKIPTCSALQTLVALEQIERRTATVH